MHLSRSTFGEKAASVASHDIAKPCNTGNQLLLEALQLDAHMVCAQFANPASSGAGPLLLREPAFFAQFGRQPCFRFCSAGRVSCWPAAPQSANGAAAGVSHSPGVNRAAIICAAQRRNQEAPAWYAAVCGLPSPRPLGTARRPPATFAGASGHTGRLPLRLFEFHPQAATAVWVCAAHRYAVIVHWASWADALCNLSQAGTETSPRSLSQRLPLKPRLQAFSLWRPCKMRSRARLSAFRPPHGRPLWVERPQRPLQMHRVCS